MENRDPSSDIDGLPSNLRMRSCNILLIKLKRVVEDHLKNLPVWMDSVNMEVEMDIKSWKELNEWELIENKREVIVNFKLDVNTVISYS